MKRGTIGHAKVANLARKLGLERWGAVGLLESLWHAAVQYAPRGDIGKATNADIAFYVGWTGDPDTLIDALLEAGWLDASEANRLEVHHWHTHADDGVHMSLARAGETFACGAIPKMTRLGANEKAACEAKYAGRAHAVHTPCTRNTHGVHTAPPSPALPSHPPPSHPIPRPASPGGVGGESDLRLNGSGGRVGGKWTTSSLTEVLTRVGVSSTSAQRLAAYPDRFDDFDVQAEFSRLKATRSVSSPCGALANRMAQHGKISLDTASIGRELQQQVEGIRASSAQKGQG